ncbi:SDR family oxidoreductase [Chondromyces apiculatus]|uniref:3-oxoacyl-[acyl-carrier protein] reductase n=1 Tax=Chondromyces apiculatus DSM 436 TaxID=1192034 RepID=A0A017TG56_9BACT|nr:SDR family oxidoreductase [Chondromyces apiculatus]EYF07541.1 3-oxoacyl-[acyl-carrier protein] reductase [Chondromyces apiculatus DSM 436]
MQRTALITGGNRGIGFEVARQLGQKGVRVILTSRDDAAGKAAAEKLTAEGGQVTHEPLDVTRDDSARALAERLGAAQGGLDILVNNAGAMRQGFNADIARDTIETNFFGPLRVTEALLPLLRPGARIVMVSSGLAERDKLGPALKERFHQPFTRDEIVAHMRRFVDAVAAGKHAAEGWPSSAYVVSKLGLNALTDHLARELDAAGHGILCNAVCPGWVRTDMGGPSANRSVEEGADTPVWLATAPEHRHQGGIFRDRKPVPW